MVQQLGDTTRKNKFLKRGTLLVLGMGIISTQIWIYLMSDISLLKHQRTEILTLDSQIKINELNQSMVMLISIQSSLIMLGPIVTKESNTQRGETYLINQTVLLGVTLLLLSNDFVITIISWELLNLSQYLLVGINSVKGITAASLSASLKYFLLGALSTGLLLTGILIQYAYTGSTNYDAISGILQYPTSVENVKLVEVGSCLILGSILFKLGVAPFHNYAIDLYEAVPNNISMYMMIIPKASLFSFIQVLNEMGFFVNQGIINLSAVLSLIVGSIGLIHQWRLKRFLAMSSVTHSGLILLSLYCNATTTFIIYLTIYSVSLICLFNGLIYLGAYRSRTDLRFINQLDASQHLNPLQALIVSLIIFSLAGCPPTLGFYAKYFVFSDLIGNNLQGIALFAILTSAIASYRYLSQIKRSIFNVTDWDEFYNQILLRLLEEIEGKSSTSINPVGANLLAFVGWIIIIGGIFKMSMILNVVTI